eukprot:3939434-Amphidinium_carterae.1
MRLSWLQQALRYFGALGPSVMQCKSAPCDQTSVSASLIHPLTISTPIRTTIDLSLVGENAKPSEDCQNPPTM